MTTTAPAATTFPTLPLATPFGDVTLEFQTPATRVEAGWDPAAHTRHERLVGAPALVHGTVTVGRTAVRFRYVLRFRVSGDAPAAWHLDHDSAEGSFRERLDKSAWDWNGVYSKKFQAEVLPTLAALAGAAYEAHPDLQRDGHRAWLARQVEQADREVAHARRGYLDAQRVHAAALDTLAAHDAAAAATEGT